MGNPQTLFECAAHTTRSPLCRGRGTQEWVHRKEEQDTSVATSGNDINCSALLERVSALLKTLNLITLHQLEFPSRRRVCLATVIHNENSEAMQSTVDMVLFHYGVFCYTPLIELPAAECLKNQNISLSRFLKKNIMYILAPKYSLRTCGFKKKTI